MINLVKSVNTFIYSNIKNSNFNNAHYLKLLIKEEFM